MLKFAGLYHRRTRTLWLSVHPDRRKDIKSLLESLSYVDAVRYKVSVKTELNVDMSRIATIEDIKAIDLLLRDVLKDAPGEFPPEDESGIATASESVRKTVKRRSRQK